MFVFILFIYIKNSKMDYNPIKILPNSFGNLKNLKEL